MSAEAFDPRDYWERRLSRRCSPAGVGYLRLGEAYNRHLYEFRRRTFPRLVRSLGLDLGSSDVLDVGSGTGFYIDLWTSLGARSVSGADLTEASVEHLRRTFPANRFHRLDVGDDRAALPFERFDVVSCIDVLFHIVDDARFATALRNLRRMTRTGGTLLFSDNFVHGPREQSLHVTIRPLADVERMVREAGFEVVWRKPMFWLMNYPSDVRWRGWRAAWKLMMAPAALAEPLGWLLGWALRYPEATLVRLCRESPTIELMACRAV